MDNTKKSTLYYSTQNKIVTVLAFILIGVFFVFYLFTTKAKIDEYAAYTLRSQLDMASMSIEAQLNDARRSIVAASADVAARWDEDRDFDVVGLVEEIQDNYPFDVLEFVDAYGINLMSGANRFDASDREYFKEGIKGNTGLWVNYEPKESKEYLLDFYSPVFYKGEIIGVLVGALGSKSTLEPLTQSTYLGYDCIGVLFNFEERAIAASFGLEGEIYADDIYEMFNLTEIDKATFSEHVSSKDGVVFSYEGDSGTGIACATKISIFDLGLIIIIPSSTFSAVYGDFTNTEIITLGAISIVVCIYILYILIANVNRYNKRLSDNKIIIEGFSKVYHTVFVLDYGNETAQCIRTKDPVAAKYGITTGVTVPIKEEFMDYVRASADKGGAELLSSIENRMFIKTLIGDKEYFSLEFNQIAGGKGSMAIANLSSKDMGKTDENTSDADRYLLGITEIG